MKSAEHMFEDEYKSCASVTGPLSTGFGDNTRLDLDVKLLLGMALELLIWKRKQEHDHAAR